MSPDRVEVLTDSTCCATKPQVAVNHATVTLVFANEEVDLSMVEGPKSGDLRAHLRVWPNEVGADRKVKVGIQVGVDLMKGASATVAFRVDGRANSWDLKGQWNTPLYKFITVQMPRSKDWVDITVGLKARCAEDSAARVVLSSIDVVAGKLASLGDRDVNPRWRPNP